MLNDIPNMKSSSYKRGSIFDIRMSGEKFIRQDLFIQNTGTYSTTLSIYFVYESIKLVLLWHLLLR